MRSALLCNSGHFCYRYRSVLCFHIYCGAAHIHAVHTSFYKPTLSRYTAGGICGRQISALKCVLISIALQVVVVVVVVGLTQYTMGGGYFPIAFLYTVHHTIWPQ